MLYTLSWLVVFSLLALWSLAAWAFHSITVWTVANAGALAGGAGTQALTVPDWVAPWIPPEIALSLNSMASSFTPAIEAMLGWVPAAEGALSVAIWIAWGIGSGLLIVIGFLATGMIAILRPRGSAQSTPTGTR